MESQFAMKTNELIIVQTAAADQDEAEKIATLLVSQKLAACVQMLPIQSCYRWKGKVVHDSEVLLLIKTRSDLYEELEAAILETHSYEVPEIVQVPIERGSANYLQWIVASTRKEA